MTRAETIDAYCGAWNEQNAEARSVLLRRSVTSDIIYVDPAVRITGITALVRHIDSVFARYPNSRIVRTSAIDYHHTWARFAWKKVLADGNSLPDGVDIVEFEEDGRLRRVIGFFGPMTVDF